MNIYRGVHTAAAHGSKTAPLIFYLLGLFFRLSAALVLVSVHCGCQRQPSASLWLRHRVYTRLCCLLPPAVSVHHVQPKMTMQVRRCGAAGLSFLVASCIVIFVCPLHAPVYIGGLALRSQALRRLLAISLRACSLRARPPRMRLWAHTSLPHLIY